jgi:gamma-glutamyltranspeptidase/glutathione hydrolase
LGETFEKFPPKSFLVFRVFRHNTMKESPFDPLYFPYPSRRSVVFARRGMVTTSHPLAAQAGLDILKEGGNAIDAAVATAAALTVLEPTSNGVGGDAFALVWRQGKLHGLNSSGFAPQKLSLDVLRKAGFECMPRFGMIPVTVPGVPAAWAALTKRFGTLPLTANLRPAIDYAWRGAPVSPVTADLWQQAFIEFSTQKDASFRHWFDCFAPGGHAPKAGEMWRSEELAQSLSAIAESDAKAFYEGKLAEALHVFSEQCGAYLRGDDLAAFSPEWVEPLKALYRGVDVWELPPNGQGLVALIALRILDGFAAPAMDSPRAWHLRIEALKLAFADAFAHIADPKRMRVNPMDFLDETYIASRRKRIGDRAGAPAPGKPLDGGTVYLATADAEGNMVSYIQSNFWGFGSGMVVPGTGIALHSRGLGFSFDPAHPNCLAPGMRPYHTIIPGFLSKNGRPLAAFGVMGAYLQPQGHVMAVSNMLDYALNPQAALDAPRFRWEEGLRVDVEVGFPAPVAEALRRVGHDMHYGAPGDRGFGRGQIIWRDEDGVFIGGSEPRCDGQAAAW